MKKVFKKMTAVMVVAIMTCALGSHVFADGGPDIWAHWNYYSIDEGAYSLEFSGYIETKEESVGGMFSHFRYEETVTVPVNYVSDGSKITITTENAERYKSIKIYGEDLWFATDNDKSGESAFRLFDPVINLGLGNGDTFEITVTLDENKRDPGDYTDQNGWLDRYDAGDVVYALIAIEAEEVDDKFWSSEFYSDWIFVAFTKDPNALDSEVQNAAEDLTLYWAERDDLSLRKFNSEEYIPLTYENVISEFKAANILDANNSFMIEKYKDPYDDSDNQYYRIVGKEYANIVPLQPINNGCLFAISVSPYMAMGVTPYEAFEKETDAIFYTEDYKTAVLVNMNYFNGRSFSNVMRVGDIYLAYRDKLLMSLDLTKWFYDSGEASDAFELYVFGGEPYLRSQRIFYKPSNFDYSSWESVQGITDSERFIDYYRREIAPSGWHNDLPFDAIKLMP